MAIKHLATVGDNTGLSYLVPDLLKFGSGSRTASGFGWLDESGQVAHAEGEYLWLTARMTYVYSLGVLLGDEESAPLAEHGIKSLATNFWDPQYHGWFSQIRDGQAVNPAKEAYQHSFVLLAAATAKIARVPGADSLLTQSIEVFNKYFWDTKVDMVLESWDQSFTKLENYRGANANMHCVEAFLALADVTGDAIWLTRARSVSDRLINGAARAHGWLLPEHYSATWEPELEYNVDNPTHKFRPYGATIGHWFEWSRLVLTLKGALEKAGQEAPTWLEESGIELFTKGCQFWAVDGVPGFVYTVDWHGQPVVRERMHWVVTEAIAAAAVLHEQTGKEQYLEWQRRFEGHLVDVFLSAPGSLHHEVGPDLLPSSQVWQGRPDIYHTVQACIIPLVENKSGLGKAFI